MRRISLVAMMATMFTSNVFALCDMYVNFGGGYVLPSSNFRTVTDSNLARYSPIGSSAIGSFFLPNVTWRNKINPGYDLNIALGSEFYPNWRAEGEFLYQNMKRQLSGSFGWQQVAAGNGDVFASQLNNPISPSSTTLYVYSFMANVYHDFKNCSRWTPSLGAGIGVSRLRSNPTTASRFLVINDETINLIDTAHTIINSPSLSGTMLTGQIKATLAFQLDNHLSVVSSYRLIGTTCYGTSKSNIITNPHLPVAKATFGVPKTMVQGLLNSLFELNLHYTI